MDILNDLYNYINEETLKLFGETETYNYIDSSKWFFIKFPYVLKNTRNNSEILLLINFEVHAYEINSVLCYCANFGFTIELSEDLEMYVPSKNKDFKFELNKDDSSITFYYKWENEFNSDNPANTIILNEHVLEIIDKFIIDLNFYKQNDSFLMKYSLPKEISSRNDYNDIVKILMKYKFNPSTLYKAHDYLKMNRVLSFEQDKCEEFNLLKGKVAGHNNNVYHSILQYKNSEIIGCKCDCLAFQNYPGPCKHIICLLMKYLESHEKR